MTNEFSLQAVEQEGGGTETVSIVLAEKELASLAAAWRNRRHTYHGASYLVCLMKLRRDLESDGLLLCSQGCRPNVCSSGSLSQMSVGREIYLFDPETGEVPKSTVDIFAPADPAEVVTLSEQRRAFFAFTGMEDAGWQMPSGEDGALHG